MRTTRICAILALGSAIGATPLLGQTSPTPAPPVPAPMVEKPPEWPKEIGGKDLKGWLTELKESTDGSVRELAIKVIPQFGPPARRESIKPFIPESVFTRRDKMGFPVPLTEWLRGPIRDFVGDIMLGTRARQRGLYRMDGVEKLLAPGAAFGRPLWGLLSLELWHQAFVDGDRLPTRRERRTPATVTAAAL